MTDSDTGSNAAITALLKQAEQLKAEGHQADALDLCIAILDEVPDCTDAMWLAGTISFSTLAFDIAEACFMQEIALKPDSVRSLIGLAQVYESQNKERSAAELYRQILAIEPDNAIARVGSGIDAIRLSRNADVPNACYTALPGEEDLCIDIPPPALIELEPTNSCNLRCKMCHVTLQPHSKGRFLDVEAFTLATEGLHDTHLIIGSEYEPTIHPKIDQILATAYKNFHAIDFITNASRLHRIKPRLIAEGKFSTFNISFDGITKHTFESIREGANFAQVMENISATRAALADRGTTFAINYVVTRSTLSELEQAAGFWNALGFDLMRILPIQLRDTSLKQESLFPVLSEYKATLERIANTAAAEKYALGIRASHYATTEFTAPPQASVSDSVLYSGNPAQRTVPTMRQDLQRGAWKGGDFPCKSPYTYARIRWDGSVDLCNREDFNIGNIHDNSLLELWHGEKANAIRRYIRRNRSICEKCDYYRFCIDSPALDIDDPGSHFADGVAQQIGREKLISWLRPDAS